MFVDPFESASDSLVTPARDCFPVAASDTADLPQATKAIYIGTGGDITLRTVAGEQDVVFRNVVSGSILDVRVKAIRATGTDASDIVGLA
ncbi:hypothetical protein [Erythrobacter sp. THAF29]|uniref:spike base protein, RCAP_Rcc01079 family n=1 Tax=Erythrobacter sp. THAF29 TaxID=2587851 RepID=UPI001268CCCD|nr:hypothetical protein [Erythrobacter sp. THAF29]QFT75973.1 hypothetical protein FIU90_00320 [Erythrobacter sp. THAF29]